MAILCGKGDVERDQHTYNIHDVTVHCMATHYITATAIHYCVEEEECGGLKEGR